MKINQNRVNTPFGDFQIDVENLVEHFFGDRANACSPPAEKSTWSPRVSISESDLEYRLVIELAGVVAENVSIEMQEDKLMVSGEKHVEELAEGFTSLRDERRKGSFSKSFEFAKQVNSDEISAEFKNGLLSVVLPKSEKVLPRKIDIKLG
ncbi:MAG: Hsp20/alpha crystallin family protein [Mariniblastus sp.]